MKKLLGILLIVFVFIGSGIIASASDKEDETEYKVTITVVYNSVSIKEADRITANARREHRDACKVEIKSDKNTSDLSAITIGGNTYFTTYSGPITTSD